MSSSTVPTQSNATSANPIHWNDPMRASLPMYLKPVNWCGRQWQKLTTLDGQNTCSKICQVILRVIPAIFLSLATISAFVVGFMGSCVSTKPIEYAVVDIKDVWEKEIMKVRAGILQNITLEKVKAVIDSLQIPEEVMQAINADRVKADNHPVTAKQLKEQIMLPLTRNVISGIEKKQAKLVEKLAKKELFFDGMRSCIFPTLIELGDINNISEEAIMRARAGILQNITPEKVEAVIDSLQIPEEDMLAINADRVKAGNHPVTAKQLKEKTMLPLVKNAISGIEKKQAKFDKELGEKKLKAELEAKQKEKSEPATKQTEVIKTEGKATINTKSMSQKPIDTKGKTEDLAFAKNSVKASATVLVFNKLTKTSDKNDVRFEISSLIRASNPFQTVANAFQTATPTLSEVVKVAVLDSLRTVDSQTMMKKIAPEVEEIINKIQGSLILEELSKFVCRKVLPALMDAIEPMLLNPSSRAKVTQWAQSVSSVKVRK